MSLTKFLENKDVKEKFLQEFPKPRFDLKKKILAPPITKHYSLVGTAFDYLMRFYLMCLNPNAKAQKWVAEQAVDILKAKVQMGIKNTVELKYLNFDFLKLASKGEEIVKQARNYLKNYMKSEKISNQLIKSAIMLAQLDPIYRAGIIDENIGIVDEMDVKDLRKLISIVNPDLFRAKNVCVLNPTFGEASKLVGGADADLLIDDMLIDIKTTKNLELDRDTFNQLVGYYILFKIGGIDISSYKKKIKKIGIYYSRYGELYTITIETVIDEKRLPSFIKWFKKRATDEYKSIL
ncbi:MAG: hypothetical protein ACUVQP_12295 [Bacteroidales bacterium]